MPVLNGKELRIVGFLCNWCSYGGADTAGVARATQPTDLRIIRVPCSGRIDPLFIVRALLNGADGVLVSGCHPRDCHYSAGNYYARRRLEVLKQFLPVLGIDERRFEYTWVSVVHAHYLERLVQSGVRFETSHLPVAVHEHERLHESVPPRLAVRRRISAYHHLVLVFYRVVQYADDMGVLVAERVLCQYSEVIKPLHLLFQRLHDGILLLHLVEQATDDDSLLFGEGNLFYQSAEKRRRPVDGVAVAVFLYFESGIEALRRGAGERARR